MGTRSELDLHRALADLPLRRRLLRFLGRRRFLARRWFLGRRSPGAATGRATTSPAGGWSSHSSGCGRGGRSDDNAAPGIGLQRKLSICLDGELLLEPREPLALDDQLDLAAGADLELAGALIALSRAVVQPDGAERRSSADVDLQQTNRSRDRGSRCLGCPRRQGPGSYHRLGQTVAAIALL